MKKQNLADKPDDLLICGECFNEGEGNICFMLAEEQAQPLNSGKREGEYFYSTVVFCRFWCHCDTLRPSPILWVKGQTSHAASHRSSRSPRDRPRGHLSRSL